MSNSFLVAVGIALCLIGCTPEEKVSPQEEQQPSQAEGVSRDPFTEGISSAANASELTQTAESLTDWEQVANYWENALDSMSAVSSDHPNYNNAQERIETYSSNLAYAQQNMSRLQEELQARAEYGGQIFNNIKGVQQVAGLATPTPVVRIIVPRDAWNGLTRDDQVSLAIYTESQIPVVRASPASYVDVPPSSPVYNSFAVKAANLCEDCWTIILSYSNTQPYGIDETVLQGDTPWQASDPCCRGAKASEFMVR